MKLLELRSKNKKRKPEFIRQDSHKKVKLRSNWRKPKGLHSKIAHKIRGYRRKPSIGYSSPKAVRGLDRSGLTRCLVNNISELKNLDPKKDGALISSTVGLRKKLELIKFAIEKKIKILNMSDPKKYLQEKEAKIKSKKEEKTKKLSEKENKKVETKKQEKKLDEAVAKTEEDQLKKKEEQKKELDKVLTKKV